MYVIYSILEHVVNIGNCQNKIKPNVVSFSIWKNNIGGSYKVNGGRREGNGKSKKVEKERLAGGIEGRRKRRLSWTVEGIAVDREVG